MTIQRQYSLPNCTLLLEGLSDTTTGSGQLDVRPVMSILVNAECHFAGAIPPLAGGREFFESLLKAVSHYAQEFLSGISHSHEIQHEMPLVQLRRIGQNLHRLIVQRRGDVNPVTNNGMTGNTGSTAPIEIDLTTVQLFDLVEAVDQFFADSQTLPSLSLQITPVERRYAHADEPVLKRATPAALGVSSLALAALVLYLVPPPKTQRPVVDPLAPTPQKSTTSKTSDASGQANSGEPSVSPSAVASETPSPSAVASETPSPSAVASETPSPSAVASETPSASPLASEIASTTASPSPSELATATTGSEITDPTQLSNLTRQLRDKLDQNWENRTQVNRSLVYRVSVDADGTIVSYTPDNGNARDRVGETPLPKLLPNPTPNPDTPQRPLADFKVVFTAKGVPQVSPWKGLTSAPVSSTPISGSEITDSAILRDLNQKLHKQILENKTDNLRFPRQLVYRVAMRPDGSIVDYEPRNPSASSYINQTPLPKLKSSPTSPPMADSQQEPLAYFKVVFTPKGVAQVSPWRGYR